MGAVCETGRRGVCVLVLAYKEERFVWASPFGHSSPSLVSSLAFRAVVRPHLTTDNISWKRAVHLIAARKQRKREKEEDPISPSWPHS